MTEDNGFPRLVWLACHDVRTPLATVTGFARTLARAEGLAEPGASYVATIEAAAGQLTELVDQLAIAAGIASGRYAPVLGEADTLELARLAAERLGAERVAVSGTGGVVRVDVQAVEGAVTSLVRCALRHGGLDRVDVVADGPELRVSPITQASAPVVLGEELRDLGAAVATRVVEALGGTVSHEGGTLRIALPAA